MKQFFLFFMFCLVFAFSSCKKDKCADTVCTTINSVCNDGVCECADGYVTNASGACVLPDPCMNVVCGLDSMCVNGTCQPGPCATINCQNGTCNNGICDCDPGYTVDSSGECTVAWNAQLTSVWTVTDICSNSGSAIYSVTAAANNSGTDQINVSNFGDVFINPVKLTMTSANTFDIILQEPDNDGFFLESIQAGTLNASGNRINVIFVISDQTVPGVVRADTCTSTWVRQ